MDTGNISSIPELESLPTGLQSLIGQFKDVFSNNIGDRPMDCKPIRLVIDEMVSKPPKTTVCRPIPLHWQSEGEEILHNLLQAGIVRRVEEPCEFISPSFFVKKGDSSGLPLLILDYKNTLNPSLVRVPHPLPSPMTLNSKVKPVSTHFLSVDLKAAFWQLPLQEESQNLMAFYSQLGVFAFTHLPMSFLTVNVTLLSPATIT